MFDRNGRRSAVPWNGSGFGANDPGRRRDTTEYKSNHFDVLFPIDLERPLDLELPASATAANILLDLELPASAMAANILSVLKTILPYTFRYEKPRNPHPDLKRSIVSMPSLSSVTAKAVIEAVVAQLPTGWQATLLPGYIILYKEARAYLYGEIIARSP
jgi:hypothetical protein